MKLKILLSLASVAVLLAASGIAVKASEGTRLTTYNFHVDGESAYACKNPGANCNSFLYKENVWLNGAGLALDLRREGDYFFSVLSPGGQHDPNDGGEHNLSDDFDTYLDRKFTVSGGSLSYSGATHWLDSGKAEGDGVVPNGMPPYIRVFPYGDTPSPGGVYILAVCSLERGYPVDPRDCRFEAFMVREGKSPEALVFGGRIFEDLYADGARDSGDPGLKHWQVRASGVGVDGQPFLAEVKSDKDGYWEIETSLPLLAEGEPPGEVNLSFCEVLSEGWTQSYPAGGGCHHLNITVSEPGSILDLDFGNWQPVEITACKGRDRNGGEEDPGEFLISLLDEGAVMDTQPAMADGCYTWTGLTPGRVYGVRADSAVEEFGPSELVWYFPRARSGDRLSHTFMNMLEGCTPGFWQGGNAVGSAGGKWLWDESNDMDWVFSGGVGFNPFVWSTPFNEFFSPVESLAGLDMLGLVDGGGGADDSQKAARDLVAAYLNAAWGMNYPYTTDQLAEMWAGAVDSGDFLRLHSELDAANNAYQNGGKGSCPIRAKHVGEISRLFLPIIMKQ